MKSSLMPIILLFLLVIVVVYIAAKLDPVLLRQKFYPNAIITQKNSQTQSNSTPSPTTLKTNFQGTNFQFNYPENWQIKKINNQGSSVELVNLGIDKAFNDTLGIFKSNKIMTKPSTNFSEFAVSGKEGWKWTESGNNYYSYYYLIPNIADNQYLELLVTLPQKNDSIENQLNNLIDSLQFK